MAEFALATSNPPTNIETLTVPLPVPRAPFQEYAERVLAASGRVHGRGYPLCQWTFSRLTSDQVEQLRVICPGVSANVYITTLANDDEYHTYQAVMTWPEEEAREPATRDRLDLSITFTHLIEEVEVEEEE